MRYKLYIDVLVSLGVACFAYFILDSSGVIEKEGIKITGGIAIYFLNFWLMHKFSKNERTLIKGRKTEIKVTQIKSREKYGDEIVRCIKAANKSVIMLMRSLKSSSETQNIKNEVASIRSAIKESIEKNNGEIDILIITGSNEEYLQDGYELKNISEAVHVYYSRSMRTSDLSAVLVDGQYLVIGFLAERENVEARSSNWLKGKSITLSSLIFDYAKKLKQNSYSYEKFISISLERMLLEHNNNFEGVCKLLGLPNCEIERLKNAQQG